MLTVTVSEPLYNLTAIILGGLTFGAVLWYATEARRAANAGIEQSEAFQKPCLVVIQPSDDSDEAMLEGVNSSIAGEVTVRFRNIGHGPAINVRFRLRTLMKNAAPLGMQDAPEIAPIAPGGMGDTNYPTSALDTKNELVTDYSSLSGARYRSRVVISNRRWVQEFRFTKLTGHEPDPPSIPAKE
jgi:hypothetical protein